MTIDEAKIYLSIQVELKHRLGKDFEAKCLQLGLEALIAVQEARNLSGRLSVERLPGETKAVDQRTANIGYGSSEALKRSGR